MHANFADKIIDHIASTGCDDVLSKPFFCDRWEEDLLKEASWRDFLRAEIGGAIAQNPVAIGDLCHIAVPKSRYTFRTVSHMSLVDTLKYTALVFFIGKEIESSRLSKKIVFSNRFDPRALKLDRSNYDGFREESKRLSESGRYKVKVITDIANYYDRLNIHKLESILKEKGCDPKIVSKINDILIRWSKKQSFGIPVGSDASRLLAEAMLINADKELSEHRVKFIRYVDDYRIFCSSQERAYEAMQLLDRALRREGLFLNSGKTKLIDLTRGHEEERPDTAEFEPIDVDEKVVKTRLERGRYASRIAKYYHFPGKEAVKKLRALDLSRELEKARDPTVSEDDLKNFVKAAIYASTPDFSWLERVLDLYPHLIPYVVDAVIKEFNRDKATFDKAFLKRAVAKFRTIFRSYSRNDYFRIQACRLLCEIDKNCGEFLSMEISRLNSGEEVVLSQVIYFLKDRVPRSRFLDMISKFSSYGAFSRTSLGYILYKELVLKQDERRAQMKNLSRFELDPFLLKLLKI